MGRAGCGERRKLIAYHSVIASGINDIANSVLYNLDYESSVEELVDLYTEEVRRMYIRGGELPSRRRPLLSS